MSNKRKNNGKRVRSDTKRMLRSITNYTVASSLDSFERCEETVAKDLNTKLRAAHRAIILSQLGK